MADHAVIIAALSMPVFFCDPTTPGSAARTRTRTGCCADTCTKNADLSTFTQDELNVIAAKLNHRPRRVLSWATPAKAFGTTEPKPPQLAPA